MLKNFLVKYNKDDSLLRDSLLFFSASMIGNLAGFFYHFYMGRVLGPADYGVLAAMLSILYIIYVAFNVIQTSISKFTAEFSAQHNPHKIAYLFIYGLKKLSIYGIIGLLVYTLGGWIFIADFAKIPRSTYFLFGILVPFVFILPLSRGILQGVQNFKQLSLNLIVEGIVKVVAGITLVYLGLRVNGAVLGIVLSFIAAFAVAIPALRHYFSVNPQPFPTKEIYKYSLPVSVALFVLTMMYSVDVILVRRFFDDVTAGYYASASMLGKVVFFATLAITTVMFPKVVALREANKTHSHILKKSLILVGAIVAVALFFNTLFPRFVITVFFGSSYLRITNLLWIFTLTFSLFSFIYLLSMYHLSMNRGKFVFFLVFSLIAEVAIISFFHTSLEEVALALCTMMAVLFLFLLVYTFYHGRH